jgi:hypothetical protein
MINVIGIRKIILLATLLVMNGLAGAGVYLYFKPSVEKIEKDLRAATSSITNNSTMITKLNQDFKVLQEQKENYTNLVGLGFFKEQDRFLAPKRLEIIREESGLLKARYKFGSARELSNEHANKAEHVVLNSEVRIDGIEAMDDMDIYKFIYLIDNTFTGQVSITSMSFERVRELDNKILHKIALGEDVSLIEGSLVFEWRTMIPEDKYKAIRGSSDRTRGRR